MMKYLEMERQQHSFLFSSCLSQSNRKRSLTNGLSVETRLAGKTISRIFRRHKSALPESSYGLDISNDEPKACLDPELFFQNAYGNLGHFHWSLHVFSSSSQYLLSAYKTEESGLWTQLLESILAFIFYKYKYKSEIRKKAKNNNMFKSVLSQ